MSGVQEPNPLERELAESFAPVIDDIARAWRALYDALGGDEGIARIKAERERWEHEHPGLKFGQDCHCWCRLRGHDGGACDHEAVTFEVRTLWGEPVQVPLCQPCADLAARKDVSRQ
jgi:hypothetical protein